MRIGFFYHSLVSDWNHGNAHFLRGVASELQARGHDVRVFEPKRAWSRVNMVRQYGRAPLYEFHRAYPNLTSAQYSLKTLKQALEGLDLALVHEWNSHEVVRQIGKYRNGRCDFRVLFHDTHHRSVTDPAAISEYDLAHYDGVLAFGEVIRRIYLKRGWTRRAWTWHEAADTRVFYPQEEARRKRDLVWIGNWGDNERTAELKEFLLEPARTLKLRTHVYGVRYPGRALKLLAKAGICYHGWLPNYQAPRIFSQYRLTVHIPRRPYAKALPGVPTIRPFEALACGIPLICSPWRDSDGLFTAGADYLVAKNGSEMKRCIKLLLNEPLFAQELAAHGLRTIRERHTCIHRVEELLDICRELGIQDGRSALTNGNGNGGFYLWLTSAP